MPGPTLLHRCLLAAACGAPLFAAALVYWFGVYYALETSNPVLHSDAWWFVEAWLVPLQDGTLTLADLWAKRHGNHAQPLTALLFLANAEWLGLDFGVETVFGVALASAYAALLLVLAHRYAPARTPLHAAWVAAAIVCILFSVNAKDKLSWSLVGLFYMGHILGLGMLWLTARQRQAPRPAGLFLAALALCALVDTTGVLWTASAAGVVLLTRASHERERAGPALRAALALLAGIGVYLLLYRVLVPAPAGPAGAGLIAAVRALAQHAGDAGYAVMPFGAALAHPLRLAGLWGEGDHDGWIVALALFCLGGHAWLWWTALRRGVNTGFATACGLALFGYATIAGILLQRVPEMGFSYLMQPRYGVFFDLLWLAPILAWACRPAQREPGALRLGAAGFFVLPCLLPLLWLDQAWNEIQWIRAWNNGITRDTWQLLQDPSQVPEQCNPHVAVCDWPLPVRQRLLDALRSDGLNIASPRFRAAHDLEPMLREAERQRAGRNEAERAVRVD